MAKFIKNDTGGDKTYSGQLISAGAYHEIQSSEELKMVNDSTLLTDIGSGDAIVAKDDSGNKDIIDINDAINYLKTNLPGQIEITSQQPFAAKILANGKKLYAREHGVTKVTIASGATVCLIFEIPYAAAKITGAQIIGCKKDDTVNFKILDTDTGTLTTIPMYPVNQFGYDVNMPDGIYTKQYNYDADLFLGLHVCVEYTNNGIEAIDVSLNLDLHEVKD